MWEWVMCRMNTNDDDHKHHNKKQIEECKNLSATILHVYPVYLLLMLNCHYHLLSFVD